MTKRCEAPDVKPEAEIVARGPLAPSAADPPPIRQPSAAGIAEAAQAARAGEAARLVEWHKQWEATPQGEGHDGLSLTLATEPAISAPDLQIGASGQRADGSGQRAPEIDPTRSGYRMPDAPIPEHRKNGHAAPPRSDVEGDPFLQMMLDEERWLEAKLIGVRASIAHYRASAPGGDSTDARSDLDDRRSAGAMSRG